MVTTIAVTGATGEVGGRVARLLTADRAEGARLRLVVRDPARAERVADELRGTGVEIEVAVAEYGEREASERALAGVDVLFMVSAAESADRLEEHRVFVEAARASGVGHIVYTSFFGAAPSATFTLARDHFATERSIEESGIGFTFLRDNFYADFLPLLAGEDGVIRGPAGDGRVAAVARADVADSAVAVLRDPAAHGGATYELTGPEALSLAEVAELLTELWGRGPIRFHDETVAEAYASRAVWEAPRWQLDAWVSTYTAIASGELARVTDDVRWLTGHAARSLRELLTASGS
ncbi:SDR family oxidoreductase [Herbiconiux sp. KACC 21604]|uniref:SDR family oxidoreductase n=1 Tax=unclassified Herbiconiux TaxID=2618217 RepID=UPI001491B9DB|nr:SDR family oxidoreductase [Herbiconiux sp. SALV-R1]QJU55355.1 SDR family oxidoreductase [Herbiconiux sp. SALV-R1]WPO86525.1 SDR family oxidoreductase [Herbiconiux sp. KACC 21604]